MTLTAREALLLSAASVVAVGLVAIGGVKLALGQEAQSRICDTLPALETKIVADGETLLGTFVSDKTGITARVYVDPDERTFTALAVRGQRACVMDFGELVRLGDSMPAGEPM